MALISYYNFKGYLEKVLNVWEYWGDDFKVDEEDKESITSLARDYQATLDEICSLENRIDMLKTQRQMQTKRITSFSVRLRLAILVKFGPKTTQMVAMPSLRAKGVGRPRKNAATLKRKNAEKKAAATQKSAGEKVSGE